MNMFEVVIILVEIYMHYSNIEIMKVCVFFGKEKGTFEIIRNLMQGCNYPKI